ncbi:MAG TPA: HipA domain-containing protein [Hanamia sp.]
MPDIKYCPCTLQPGYSTYSPTGRMLLFGSRTKAVSHVLSFGPPGKNAALTREYNEKRKGMSISGYQEKYSLRLEKKELVLVENKGSYILKPVPTERLERVEDMPSNEQVTMQIATQVFNIKTAAAAMIFFNDGTPAYITRRFDYKPDGSKYQVEDFATLLGRTSEAEGDDYKYNASYLDMAHLIQQYVPAAKVELLNFFKLVVFNYLIANGDAHLKNFSVMESSQGDYLLSPAYDLMNTALHLNDADICMRDGLFEGDYKEPVFEKYGIYTRQSFLSFATRIDIPVKLAENILDEMTGKEDAVKEMVSRSFLSDDSKVTYYRIFDDRQKRLNKSY